jgi:hypothetical protein
MRAPYRLWIIASTLLAGVTLAGCAQQRQPGYYEPAHESTQTDARGQAQGRDSRQAPAQLQLGFGDNQKAEPAKTDDTTKAAAPAPTPGPTTIRPLAEAKTFLGTVPCLLNPQSCTAARLTLTLAPSGEWRARTEALDGADKGKATFDQGCWQLVGIEPWRIVLQTPSSATSARLTFINDNLLQVNTLNDIRPSLDYRLTRQAEVDGISDLKNAQPLNCRP